MSLLVRSIGTGYVSNINNINMPPVYSSVAREQNRRWAATAISVDGNRLVALNGYPSFGLIYTSNDGGESWTSRANTKSWIDVASNDNGSQLVAVVNEEKIYRSTDGGINWTEVTTSPVNVNRGWARIESSANGNILVAATANILSDGRIYTSGNGGLNWTLISTSPVDINRTWSGLACSDNGNTMFAVVFSGRIYRSTNSGANWTELTGSPVNVNRFWNGIACNSDGTRVVAVTSNAGIYISTDSGTTWNLTSAPTGITWNDIDSDGTGNRLIACSTTNIYTSFNGGTTWVARDISGDWRTVSITKDGSKAIAVIPNGQIYIISMPLYNNIITLNRPVINITGSNTSHLNTVGIPISYLSSASSITATNYSSLYIDGPPVISNNITGTNAYALNVASGNSIFGGNATVTNQLNLNRAGGGFSNTNATFSKTINTGTSSTPIFTVTCSGIYGAMFVEMIAVGTSNNIPGIGVVCNSVISVTANNAPQIYQTLNTPVSGNLAVTTYWGNANSGFNFQGTVSGSTVTYSIQTSGGGGAYDVYVRAYGGGSNSTFTINN